MELLKIGWSTLHKGLISCPNCKRASCYAVGVLMVWDPTTLVLNCECGQKIHIIDHQGKPKKEQFDREDLQIIEQIFEETLNTRKLTEEEMDLWTMVRQEKRKLSKAN